MRGKHHDAARRVADGIADQLSDARNLGLEIDRGPSVTGLDQNYAFSSLASGFPGISVLFSDRVKSGAEGAGVVHDYLSRSVNLLRQEPRPGIGLYSQITGLAFAAALAQQAGGSYRTALSNLDAHLALHVRALCERAVRDAPGAMDAYDVIDGLTGIGRYLLLRGGPEHPDLENVVRTLITLAGPSAAGPADVPGLWATSPPNQRPEFVGTEIMATGHLNLGLGHGVAGPLALLSLCLQQGTALPGQSEAIETLASLYEKFALEDTYGLYWPNTVSLSEWTKGRCDVARARTAWCYGSPGIPRALQLAGSAMGRTDWSRMAEASVSAVVDMPLGAMQAEHPSLCHGWAGIMHVLSFFTEGSEGSRVRTKVDTLAEAIIDYYGAGDTEFSVTFGDDGHEPAGFLEGAAGIALALYAYAAGEPAVPWDAALLIR
ncbi:lanthionine synthetase C family protein [Streptomyces sp. 378]|uniref:lanthionine synthetase C family protein n=1 Tax=Streptomyces sp. 378 TaxID=3049412 RepID=UPI0024C35254|nr:lanthionine synthetase C family protein [Streptomyces sp. 378]MDK1349088.1 lanthionine synthetase C family protein [Streptomyces sp. 378]